VGTRTQGRGAIVTGYDPARDPSASGHFHAIASMIEKDEEGAGARIVSELCANGAARTIEPPRM